MATDRFTTDLGPERPHLVQPGGGLSGEVYDLRQDMQVALTRVAEEFDGNTESATEVAELAAENAANVTYLENETVQLQSSIDQVSTDSAAATAAVSEDLAATQTDVLELEAQLSTKALNDKALSGDMQLRLSPLADEDVSAAELNAAAAGEFTKDLAVVLETADGDAHIWASLTPVLTPAYVGADGDITDPTLGGDTAFDAGRLLMSVIFDTDGGSTKTYTSGESVTVTVQVSAGNSLLGWTVASVTKTYNVVA